MPIVVGKDQSKVKRTTCGHCSSILEYTPSEVLSRNSMDYTGGVDVIKFIQCPCCTHQVTVSRS